MVYIRTNRNFDIFTYVCKSFFQYEEKHFFLFQIFVVSTDIWILVNLKTKHPLNNRLLVKLSFFDLGNLGYSMVILFLLLCLHFFDVSKTYRLFLNENFKKIFPQQLYITDKFSRSCYIRLASE